MKQFESLKEKLEEMQELISEALHFMAALEEHNYIDSNDEDKLNEELEKILKDLGIELEYDE